MPAIIATAPGKAILFGEHAVVYKRPAIAVPVTKVRSKAIIVANPIGGKNKVTIEAPDINLFSTLEELDLNHPIAVAIHLMMKKLNISELPAFSLRVTSTIPIASGLGSSASTAIVIIRALNDFIGGNLSNKEINQLAFEVEIIHHGTPSGIDNSVITSSQPVFFITGKRIQRLKVGVPLRFIIGNTGIKSLTSDIVAEVKKEWQINPQAYEVIFNRIRQITLEAKKIIAKGDKKELGQLMNKNHEALQDLNVSCKELDILVNAAKQAGALGAKLCGAGRGGNMISLIENNTAPIVEKALMDAGAISIITTLVKRI
ncbi:MAG TPA: mevalonate kinase [Anaerolineae bacterium]|nr:mevalonate kinase [Anaerolineae bacterium]